MSTNFNSSVLKDVPFIPAESFGPRQRDSVRLSMFPNLNYSGLYEAVMNIIDVVPMLQNEQDKKSEILKGCVVHVHVNTIHLFRLFDYFVPRYEFIILLVP